MKKFKILSILVLSLFVGESIFAQTSKNIVETALTSKEHSTLVAAVRAGGLIETLSGKGPFTVFAPTNDAFAKLPADVVTNLLKPENKAKLQAVLTYHVVAGNLNSTAVVEAIKKGNGKATLTTVQGNTLTASIDGDNVIITDANGGKAKITAVDLTCSNGVIHVLDTVILPKM